MTIIEEIERSTGLHLHDWGIEEVPIYGGVALRRFELPTTGAGLEARLFLGDPEAVWLNLRTAANAYWIALECETESEEIIREISEVLGVIYGSFGEMHEHLSPLFGGPYIRIRHGSHLWDLTLLRPRGDTD